MQGKMLLLPTLLASICVPQSASKPPNTTHTKAASAQEGITKEQAAKILQELQMIRMLLQKDLDSKPTNSTEPPDTKADSEYVPAEKVLRGLGNHVLGSAGAAVTLVEFVDLECPFCIQFHNDVFPEVRRKYLETGNLRFVVFNFPLPSHPYADPAAKMAICAGQQGKYWEIFNTFLSSPHVATPEVMLRMANDNRLDQKELDRCLNNDATEAELRYEENAAREFGVYGTPSFLLGRSRGDGVAGQIIEGAPSLASFEKRIDELLTQSSSSGQPASSLPVK